MMGSITKATSVSIDQGIGTQAGSFVVISPASAGTYAYTLTAANSSGSDTASKTVVVAALTASSPKQLPSKAISLPTPVDTTDFLPVPLLLTKKHGMVTRKTSSQIWVSMRTHRSMEVFPKSIRFPISMRRGLATRCPRRMPTRTGSNLTPFTITGDVSAKVSPLRQPCKSTR
jgi:PKD repeat protein